MSLPPPISSPAPCAPESARLFVEHAQEALKLYNTEPPAPYAAAKLTGAQLAQALGVSRSTVYKWRKDPGCPCVRKRGKKKPRFYMVEVLKWARSRGLYDAYGACFRGRKNTRFALLGDVSKSLEAARKGLEKLEALEASRANALPDDRTHKRKKNPPSDTLLTVSQLAEKLRVTPRAVRFWRDKPGFPAPVNTKPDGSPTPARYPLAQVRQWASINSRLHKLRRTSRTHSPSAPKQP